LKARLDESVVDYLKGSSQESVPVKDLGWLALRIRVAQFIQAPLELRGEGYSQKKGLYDLGYTRSLALISITFKSMGTSFG